MPSGLPTDPARSALMRRIRRKGTAPELLVAGALRSLGLFYRKNVSGLPGTPDFVNRRQGWTIFVQGCYWHHHRCKRGTVPTRNQGFWIKKFASNRRRDARNVRELRRKGLRVLLVWECEAFAGEPMLEKLRKLKTGGTLETRERDDKTCE
ncbi:very short patch repair endonuclease [Lichenihabitans sp. Uapishka_5]|uniref:very short patch repair endonuclease n=1 Tax=Lichenihabitans sp. Uapishka_5 TaxID=3037302 RepID=UPI0029E8222D|nr:very short patch repair endonuclease [Lichenihabitans sp. Uapishka_5]MDX7952875.1 very short patch repair endonuclease [Lichenihabitans sp. Uapishka_5]